MLALLEWQVAVGADEAIGDVPVNRYALPTEPARSTLRDSGLRDLGLRDLGSRDLGLRDSIKASLPIAAPPVVTPQAVHSAAVAQAHRLADGATDLAGLVAAMGGYTFCDLRLGARNLVFADGLPGASVMIIGDPPGRDDDIAGRPFVGKAGQLLDRMFAAIGLSRTATDPAQAVYVTHVLPWRPPSDRAPDPAEIAMLLPFLERHIALADPKYIVLMGNGPCQALLGQTGITRLRGTWAQVLGRPALPMVSPGYLLGQPAAKREAWVDLLALKARLS